jgi:hypothetical protein
VFDGPEADADNVGACPLTARAFRMLTLGDGICSPTAGAARAARRLITIMVGMTLLRNVVHLRTSYELRSDGKSAKECGTPYNTRKKNPLECLNVRSGP